MPSVRLSEEAYKKIKADADIERRSVPAQIEMMYDHYHLDLVPREYPLPPKIKDENPEKIGSQANKEEAKAEPVGRREVFTVPQLISKIEDIRKKADEEAEYCQDPDTIKRIYAEADAEIQPLQAQIDSMV